MCVHLCVYLHMHLYNTLQTWIGGKEDSEHLHHNESKDPGISVHSKICFFHLLLLPIACKLQLPLATLFESKLYFYSPDRRLFNVIAAVCIYHPPMFLSFLVIKHNRGNYVSFLSSAVFMFHYFMFLHSNSHFYSHSRNFISFRRQYYHINNQTTTLHHSPFLPTLPSHDWLLYFHSCIIPPSWSRFVLSGFISHIFLKYQKHITL